MNANNDRTTDLTQLDRWFALAVKATSLEEFQRGFAP